MRFSWITASYNPATNTWQAGALYQDKIFVAAGEYRNKQTYSEFEAYDVKTGRWASFTPMPMGRHDFGGVVVDSNLYFAGGATGCCGGGRTNELLVFSLP